MDTQAHKCPSCKKAYIPTKISQVYCSAKCRQTAYRKRKQKITRTHKRKEEQQLILLSCDHCAGTFFAKRDTARFCSTSCRTLFHRALRMAVPKVLMNIYGMSEEKALDIMETQPIGKIRQILITLGYSYQHQSQTWVKS